MEKLSVKQRLRCKEQKYPLVSCLAVRHGVCTETHQTSGPLSYGSLASINGINWQGRVTNIEALDKSRLTNIEAMIFRVWLCWIGHIILIDSSHILHQLPYGVLMQGYRNQGHSRRWYKDCIKESIKHNGVPAKELEPCSQDRTVLCTLTKRAFINIENIIWHWFISARERSKASTPVPNTNSVSFQCHLCPRLCVLNSWTWQSYLSS